MGYREVKNKSEDEKIKEVVKKRKEKKKWRINEEICIETNGNEMEDKHEVKDCFSILF